MKMRSVAPMRIAKFGCIAISALLCAIGIFFIAVPDISAKVIGTIVGIAMIIFGALRLVGCLSKDLYRLAFQFDMETGILLMILGGIILINPKNLMFFICIVIGISILIDGIFKIRISVDSKKFGIKSWWAILALAIITAVIGSALIFDSAKGAEILTVILGISLLAEGILNLYTVITTVRIIKNQQPDIIEAEYYEISDNKN